MEVKPHGLLFADGSELEADEIIFATGYENMRGTARKIFGDEIADSIKDVWGFDEEGELRTMWRRTGHPGFWFFGGNLALCRYASTDVVAVFRTLMDQVFLTNAGASNQGYGGGHYEVRRSIDVLCE